MMMIDGYLFFFEMSVFFQNAINLFVFYVRDLDKEVFLWVLDAFDNKVVTDFDFQPTSPSDGPKSISRAKITCLCGYSLIHSIKKPWYASLVWSVNTVSPNFV